MVKIEAKDFYPISDDKDFRIKIRTPSYSEYKDVEIEANKSVASGGPEEKEGPLRMKVFVEKLLSICVLSVHGLEINGKNISNHEEFFKHAPSKWVNAVLGEIGKLAKAGEDEIKN